MSQLNSALLKGVSSQALHRRLREHKANHEAPAPVTYLTGHFPLQGLLRTHDYRSHLPHHSFLLCHLHSSSNPDQGELIPTFKATEGVLF